MVFDLKRKSKGNWWVVQEVIGKEAWLYAFAKKKEVVVQSSGKAQHILIAGATYQVLWLRKILSDLEKNLIESIVIKNDNISTVIMVHKKV